jgi:lysyl-tRNA synthetase class 2
VKELYNGEIERISIADIILKRFDVDLWRDPLAIEGLSRSIANRFKTKEESPPVLFDRFIVEDIEPMSRDRCLLVTDFPDIPEVRAKRTPGAANVSQRFEILIDGIEVVHGYADEPDHEVLKARALLFDNFGPEDEIMCRLLVDGAVPGDSSGFGIGIERLCQVCLKKTSLRPFSTSWAFVE